MQAAREIVKAAAAGRGIVDGNEQTRAVYIVAVMPRRAAHSRPRGVAPRPRGT
jgi:hypothetical protein